MMIINATRRSMVSEADSWQEKLEQALAGDSDMLGRLCQQYLHPKAYAFAVTFLRNPHDAEDIVQDVFERLLKFHNKIRKHTLKSFEALVITMTKNACIDFLRKQKCLEPIDEKQSVNRTPQDEFTRQEILECVKTIFQNELDEIERKIFIKRCVEEHTFQSIAEQMGIPLTTIHYRYQKILEKIDQHTNLRTYWEEINRE